MRSLVSAASVLVLGCIVVSCNLINQTGVVSFIEEPFPEKLSEWRLFVQDGSGIRPNERVLPYDLNTPLFSDYSNKHRFVWMPDGTAAKYVEHEPFEFPTGTIIVKSFAFPQKGATGQEKLIETRLLVHSKNGWKALPYIWNDDQSDAKLEVVGGTREVMVMDQAGIRHYIDYIVPNTNECAQCHDRSKKLLPIGPKARNLNRDFTYDTGRENQLAYWARVGYLKGLPARNQIPRAAVWNDPVSGSLDERARSYLDNNCAHCHQAGGSAGYTGFLLDLNERDIRKLGYCKNPNSAGYSGNLEFDVVPGKPDESILLYRMLSTRPKEMMPEIGRTIIHKEGIELVREWLSSLKGNCE